MNRRAFLLGSGAVIVTAASGVRAVAPAMSDEQLLALVMQRYDAAVKLMVEHITESIYRDHGSPTGGLHELVG